MTKLEAACIYIRASSAAVHQAMQCRERFPDSLSKWQLAADAWFALLRLCDDDPDQAWTEISVALPEVSLV